MENNIDSCKLLYNTERVKLWMPEYGRNVQKMVDYLKTIEDRDKRNEQARAIVRVMEILNPQVHVQENWEQKLWDHLHIISGFDLDVDSPYPAPTQEHFYERPEVAAITSAASFGLILCAMSNAETPLSYCLTLPSGNVMFIMSFCTLKSKIAKIGIFF